MIKKVLFRNGKKLYWKGGDIHSEFGVVKEADLESCGSTVMSHTGKEFHVMEANFLDRLEKIKRGPQTLVLKDLGYLLANSGVHKDSLVVDAGAGCGILAIFMAKIAKKVVSYDKRESHLNIARKNVEFLGVDNVELKLGDVTEKIDETDVDILTLDIPQPWDVNFDCVKNGGTILIYLPTITQVSDFCEHTNEHVVKVVELIEREWHVDGKKVRPKSQMLAHTAFLIVVRKT